MSAIVYKETFLGEKINYCAGLQKFMWFEQRNDGSGCSIMHSFKTEEEVKEHIKQVKEAEEEKRLKNAWWHN